MKYIIWLRCVKDQAIQLRILMTIIKSRTEDLEFLERRQHWVWVFLSVPWPNEQHVAQSLITVSQPFKEFPAFYANRRFISVQTLPTDFFKIRFNIILPFMLRSSEWFLSLKFPHQTPVIYNLYRHFFTVNGIQQKRPSELLFRTTCVADQELQSRHDADVIYSCWDKTVVGCVKLTLTLSSATSCTVRDPSLLSPVAICHAPSCSSQLFYLTMTARQHNIK